MKIILDERYYIESEMYGFVLRDGKDVTTRKNKDGSTSEEIGIIGYYGTLPQATARYIQTYLNENLQETTLKEYIAEYQKQVDRIIGLLPEIKENT